MAGIYLLMALYVLLTNVTLVPGMFAEAAVAFGGNTIVRPSRAAAIQAEP